MNLWKLFKAEFCTATSEMNSQGRKSENLGAQFKRKIDKLEESDVSNDVVVTTPRRKQVK